MGGNIKSQLENQFSKYLKYLELHKYSQKTTATYKDNFKKFSNYISGKKISGIQDIDLELLEDYRLCLIKSDLAESSVHTNIAFIRRFFSYLEKTGILFIDPAEELKNAKPAKKLQFVPSWETIEKLLAQPDISKPEGVRDRSILETCISCALRRNELLSLDITDVNLKDRTLKVYGKGSRERALPLTGQAVYWLSEYFYRNRKKLLGKKADHWALWISSNGNRIGINSLNFLLLGYCRQAGIKTVSTHQIRRLVATEMLRNGANPMMIQHLLGHSTMQILSSYLKITITDLKKTHKQTLSGK